MTKKYLELTSNETLPWIEKYRPDKLEGIISHRIITDTLSNFIKNKELPHLLFHGLAGTGKCLAYDTPIIMYDGTVQLVQNIKQNDLLMGDDNKPRKVLNVTSGRDIMYQITQEYGDSYTVNSEHIISLKLNLPFIENWTKNKNQCTLIWFEKHVQKHKVFDGNENDIINNIITHKNYLITNSISNNREDICDICIKKYLDMPKYWKIAYGGFKCEEIKCWTTQNIDDDPYVYGYSLENIMNGIPNKYKINDVTIRSHILAGFLDSIDKLDNTCNLIIHQSKDTFDDLIFIARSLELNVYDIKPIEINGKFYFKANLGGIKILNIPTKTRNLVITEVCNIYGINVKQLNYDDYYGFEIDGNKRFLLGDFTVTHNTSMITAVAKELYKENYEVMTMEINASEERGIEIVRNRIIQFANSKSMLFDDKMKDMFKLIILDEADAMTPDAQASLRRVIEKYTKNVRFCLICNYIKKIDIAIQSRCTCFRFAPLKSNYIKQKLNQIINKENIKYENDGLDTIIKRSKGDMRKVLNILQSVSMAYDIVSKDNVDKCLGYPCKEDIFSIIKSLLYDSFKETYNLIKYYRNEMGYSLIDIITEIHDFLISVLLDNNKNDLNITQQHIQYIINNLGKIEYNVANSSDETVQTSAFIAIFKLKQ